MLVASLVLLLLVPPFAIYAFIVLMDGMGALSVAGPWQLAIYAAIFHFVFLGLTLICAWLYAVAVDLDCHGLSNRGIFVLATIMSIVSVFFTIPNILERRLPDEFPPSSPRAFYSPGDRLNFTVELAGQFMEGNIVATGNRTVFKISEAEPASLAFPRGAELPASTGAGSPHWGDRISSSGRGPGRNLVRYRSVERSFSLTLPSRNIEAPTRVRGEFVFEAIYPSETASSAFANRQSDVQTKSVSFLAVSESQAAIYKANNRQSDARRPMLVLSYLFSFVYCFFVVFFWEKYC